MTTGAKILAVVLAVAVGAAWRASVAGWGVPVPVASPPSIREGSVRAPAGAQRTRFFVGGGLHGGK